MGFFQRLKEGLSKTRGNFTTKVDDLVANTQVIDDDFYEELTDILILADAGVTTTDRIISTLRDQVKAQRVRDAQEARQLFKSIIVEEMNVQRPPLQWPMVMLVVGVNGVGKTTTVGKLAFRRLAAASCWLPRIPSARRQMSSCVSGPSALMCP